MSDDAPILEGRTWIFPDGTRLPLIAGGSDTGPAPDAGAPPAEPVEGQAAELEQEPAFTPEPGEDLWPEDARKAIEKVREDAKRQRSRFNERLPIYDGLEGVFGALGEESTEAIVNFAAAVAAGDRGTVADFLAANLNAIADDPMAVPTLQRYGLTRAQAVEMKETAEQVLADEKAGKTPAAGEQPPGEGQWVKLEDVERMIDERVQRQIDESNAAIDAWHSAKAEADDAFEALDIDPLSDYGVVVRNVVTEILQTQEWKRGRMTLTDAINRAAEQVDQLADQRVRAKVDRARARQEGAVPPALNGAPVAGQVLSQRGRDAERRRVEATRAALTGGTDR